MIFGWILNENGLEFAVWIDLAQDRDAFCLPQNAGKFFTSLGNVIFSRIPLSYAVVWLVIWYQIFLLKFYKQHPLW
jgi:hypothetical protein